MVYTYLVTGANKGIGLSIVEKLVEKDDVKVIATARQPGKATELKKLAEISKKVEIIELDVSSKSSIAKLKTQLESVSPDGIDFLIGNAGVAGPIKRTIDIPDEEYLKVFNVNLFGSLAVFRVVYPFLLQKDTRKVAFTSSGIASLSAFIPLPQAPYGISKVALNYLTKSLALDHGPENFTIITVHPGLVKTDMSDQVIPSLTPEQLEQFSGFPMITPEESADYLVKLYDSITTKDSGKFYNYEGDEYPL